MITPLDIWKVRYSIGFLTDFYLYYLSFTPVTSSIGLGKYYLFDSGKEIQGKGGPEKKKIPSLSPYHLQVLGSKFSWTVSH